MRIEPFTTKLIERYLDARGWRFSAAATVNEFLVLLSSKHGRLHVHVRVNGSRRDVLVVRVSASAHHPAADRNRLMEFA